MLLYRRIWGDEAANDTFCFCAFALPGMCGEGPADVGSDLRYLFGGGGGSDALEPGSGKVLGDGLAAMLAEVAAPDLVEGRLGDGFSVDEAIDGGEGAGE